MLYVVFGTDGVKARDKARSLVDALQKKKPDAAVIRIDEMTAPEVGLQEYIGSQGLFEKRSIVLLDHLFTNEETEAAYLKALPELKDSPNIFIVLEGKIDAKTKKKLEKYAEKIQEFSPAVTEKQAERLNVFALTDAFGERNKVRLWVLFQEALRAGSVVEELHGILFWQMKAMLLAAKTHSAAESGLKPFVYGKAKGFLRNYTREEVHQKSKDFVELYHRARRGAEELPIALERFILTL